MYRRLATPKWLMIGAAIQAISPLWLLAWPWDEWPFIPFNVQFAIGEALAFPLLDEYAMRMAPAGEEAFYASWAATPRVLGRMLSFFVSTQLLNGFCPTADVCALPAQQPILIWFVSMLIAAMTPMALLFLWMRGIVLDDRDDDCCDPYRPEIDRDASEKRPNTAMETISITMPGFYAAKPGDMISSGDKRQNS